MNLSATITAGVALLAIGGGTWAMLSGATPYMTVKEARVSHAERLNVVGDIVKESVHEERTKTQMTFRLRDPDGTEIPVRYSGEPISNIQAATRIVALGHIEGGEFVSDKLLIKCPSKYEEERKPNAVAKR